MKSKTMRLTFDQNVTFDQNIRKSKVDASDWDD